MGKAPSVDGTGNSVYGNKYDSGDYKDFTQDEKTKLAGIEAGANNYTHPTTHPASMITDLPTSLPADGGDADTVGGFTVGVNVPSGAKFTDTVYTHPASHPPSIITQDASNRFVTDTEKANWNGRAVFKNGSSTFPVGTTHTITDAFITTNTLITISPTAEKAR